MSSFPFAAASVCIWAALNRHGGYIDNVEATVRQALQDSATPATLGHVWGIDADNPSRTDLAACDALFVSSLLVCFLEQQLQV